MRTLAKAIAGLGAVIYLAAGVWAFSAPESFGDWILYPPYNRHLIHDLGAFQLGLGVAALVGIYLRDALVAVLTGVAAGSVMHAISHVLDRSLGGRASDPWVIGAFAAVLVLGAVAAFVSRVRR